MRAGRLAEPGDNYLGWAITSAVAVVLMVTVVTGWGISLVTVESTPANPMAWTSAVISGEAQWTWVSSALLALVVVILGIAMAVVGVALLKRKRNGTRVDPLARSMSRQRDRELLSSAHLARDAKRLGVSTVCGDGVPIGRAVGANEALGSSWEWTQMWIMGPRAGKTTCVCVPQIVSTRGPVLATSNKRDLVDLTRGVRSQSGKVWVHDPQGLVNEPPAWTWSPLSYVTSVARADEMVSVFAASSRSTDAKTDAYFDGMAQSLLSAFILAAGLTQHQITDVLAWLNQPEDDTPELLLRRAGQDISADSVRSVRELNPKQRDGVFGSAQPLLGWVRDEQIREWVLPQDGVPEFDPNAFVRSRDTLYAISKEGAGSARALTAALTVAVTRAAEEFAVDQGGRLREPLLLVLDEAANVCRWPALPDLYSHYGSRGIVINTILQSWPQGAAAWGDQGMKKMWSAANVRGVGVGTADHEFASTMSNLIGEHDVRTRSLSTSSGKGGRSTGTNNRREKIMDAATFSALPQKRAVILTSGLPPVLIKLVHWTQLDCAALVEASEKHYNRAPEQVR